MIQSSTPACDHSRPWNQFIVETQLQVVCFAALAAILSRSHDKLISYLPHELKCAASLSLGGALLAVAQKGSFIVSEMLFPPKPVPIQEAAPKEPSKPPSQRIFIPPISVTAISTKDLTADFKKPLDALKAEVSQLSQDALCEANHYMLNDAEVQEAFTIQKARVDTAHEKYSKDDTKFPYEDFMLLPSSDLNKLEPETEWRPSNWTEANQIPVGDGFFKNIMELNPCRFQFKSDGANIQDQYIEFGGCQANGDRSAMEDRSYGNMLTVGQGQYPLFGVFDGHGGSKAADYIQENLPSLLEAKLDEALRNNEATSLRGQDTIIYNAIKSTIIQLHKEYLDDDPDVALEDKGGTTINIGLKVGDFLYVANVGDSRMILIDPQTGEVQSLSEDAEVSNKRHQMAVWMNGGTIEKIGSEYVIRDSTTGCLAMGSSFGDYRFKANPTVDITKTHLDRNKELIALSFSDGASRMVTPNILGKAISGRFNTIARSRTSAQAIAEDIVYSCLQQSKPSDNISIVALKIAKHEDALKQTHES